MDLNGCINLALRQVPLEARPALASSPIEAVRDLFDLQVHAAEHLGKEHGAGGGMRRDVIPRRRSSALCSHS